MESKLKSTNGILSEKELVEEVESGNIEYVTLCLPFCLQIFNKSFEAKYFVENILNKSDKFPEIIFTYNIENNIVNTERLGLQRVNDVPLVIDKSTIRRMSWQGKEYAICIGTLYNSDNINYHWGYPRNVLINTISNIQNKYSVYFLGASELEFYIFDKPNFEITKNFPELDLEKHKISKRISDYCVSTIMARNETFLKPVKDNIRNCGITLEGLFTEHGPGQHEVNIKYGDVLKNCDDHIYLKQCIKHTLHNQGMGSSFLAKTFSDRDGSSCHVHISGYDSKTNENYFAPYEDDSLNYKVPTKGTEAVSCSMNMIYFIGGILNYLEDMFIIYAPNINSYKRFRKNTFAPFWINTWCYDSRLSTIRIIGSGKNLHLEFRLPGADANPYLLFTAVIASGMKGIEHKILPPEIETGNTYENLKNYFKAAPNNLYEAAKLFKQSEFAEEVFGKELKDYLLAMVFNEWQEFMNQITNYEINRYLDVV